MSDKQFPLSLIVPFRDAGHFLPELLRCFSDETSVELLFVDDGSRDNSRNLISDFARKSSLNIAVYSSDGVGPGAARNRGIEQARGEYLGFCDADDVVDTAGLYGFAVRLSEASADLGVFNHQRLYRKGRLKKNRRTDILSSLSGSVGSYSEKMMLLNNFNVCWNKLYSASFVRQERLAFPEGIYEDIPWSIGAVMLADKILVTDDVFYTYRQHASSTLKGRGEPHLVLFDQYQEALNTTARLQLGRVFLVKLVVRASRHGFLVAYERTRMGFATRGRFFKKFKQFMRGKPGSRDVLLSPHFDVFEKATFLTRSRWPLEIRRQIWKRQGRTARK